MSKATIKRIIIVSFLIVASYGAAAPSTVRNTMTKCFHHRGTLSDKVVCYFTEDPICTAYPRLADAQQERERLVRFFIPLTEYANNEVKEHASRVTQRVERGYTVAFEQVDKPMRGIQLEIKYDPSKIEFCYAKSDAIHTHKALVFNFHHKSVVNEIQRKSEGISKLAMHKIKQPTVVIDCGHGGADTGKVGLYNTCEKDINLSVGFQVADALKKKGYRVLCTRTADTFIALDERTTYANIQGADLFVSIHANGSQNSNAEGIETYWAPSSLLKPQQYGSDRIDRRFNQLALKRDAASKLLAEHVHGHVLEVAQKKYKVKDRMVKEAVSQVLIGTDMPAALIELGFLSHETEARQLANKHYHKQIAQGICTGIEQCINHLRDA